MEKKAVYGKRVRAIIYCTYTLFFFHAAELLTSYDILVSLCSSHNFLLFDLYTKKMEKGAASFSTQKYIYVYFLKKKADLLKKNGIRYIFLFKKGKKKNLENLWREFF